MSESRTDERPDVGRLAERARLLVEDAKTKDAAFNNLSSLEQSFASLVPALLSAIEQQEAALRKVDQERDYNEARVFDLAKANAQMTARLAEVEGALRRYGWHRVDCAFMQDQFPCDCGLAAALSRIPESP